MRSPPNGGLFHGRLSLVHPLISISCLRALVRIAVQHRHRQHLVDNSLLSSAVTATANMLEQAAVATLFQADRVDVYGMIFCGFPACKRFLH